MMSSPALLYLPRLLILAILAVMTMLDWKMNANQRAEIAALKYNAQADVLQHRLDAALQIIRRYNGDKAVTLPNGDGTFYIDRIDPGESVTLGVTVSPFNIPPAAETGPKRKEPEQ